MRVRGRWKRGPEDREMGSGLGSARTEVGKSIAANCTARARVASIAADLAVWGNEEGIVCLLLSLLGREGMSDVAN